MKQLSGWGIFLSMVVATSYGWLPGSVGNVIGQSASRSAWRYTGTGGESTFVHIAGKKWIIYRGDGRSYLYLETARTPDYIELRGPTTNIWFRLGDARGQTRSSAESPWRQWVQGKWVARPDLTTFDRFGGADYRVRLIYFVPTDREPANGYEKKVAVVMSMVADLYKKDLAAKGYSGGLTFETRDNAPVVHLIRGKERASFYNDAPGHDPTQHFAKVGRELLTLRADPQRYLLVVFAETYEEGPSNEVWKGHIARGTSNPPDGGLAVYSSWLLKDEFSATSTSEQQRLFADKTPIRGRKAIGHSGPDSPRFEFVEDAIGAVAHELGHALGLPHDYREPNIDIMGNGFRNLRWNFIPQPHSQRATFSAENARLLMSSRFINPALDFADQEPPSVALTLKRQGDGAVAHLSASDDVGLRAVVFYDRSGQRSTVVYGKALKGKSAAMSQDITPRSADLDIEVFVTDEGGNVTRRSAKLAKG